MTTNKWDVLIPGQLRILYAHFNNSFTDESIAEVAPFLQNQVTFAEGPSCPRTSDHQMARFADTDILRDYDREAHNWPSSDYMTYYREKIEDLIAWRTNMCEAHVFTPAGELYAPSKKILPNNTTAAILAFGESRNILFYEFDKAGNRKRNMQPHRLTMNSGDLLIMEGEFAQQYCYGLKAEPHRTELHLSYTFRKL